MGRVGFGFRVPAVLIDVAAGLPVWFVLMLRISRPAAAHAAPMSYEAEVRSDANPPPA